MSGIVYKITNIINGKIYIGQTTQTAKRRWDQHCQVNDCKIYMPIVRAIKKYGRDCFLFEVIGECDNYFDLNELEANSILYFNSIAPYGYNLQPGGNCSTFTEETRQKMSKAKRHCKPRSKSGFRGVNKTSDGYSWQASYKTKENISTQIGRYKTP